MLLGISTTSWSVGFTPSIFSAACRSWVGTMIGNHYFTYVLEEEKTCFVLSCLIFSYFSCLILSSYPGIYCSWSHSSFKGPKNCSHTLHLPNSQHITRISLCWGCLHLDHGGLLLLPLPSPLGDCFIVSLPEGGHYYRVTEWLWCLY